VDVEATCWIDISLAAFASNVAKAKRALAGDAELMVAVKSDAYGHGEVSIANTALAHGAGSLAVLDIESGVRLRPHVGDTMLLAWLLSPHDDFAKAQRAGVDLGISALWQLDKLAHEATGGPVSLHLKIDTGLHRNGALQGDWVALCEAAAAMEKSGRVRVRGIWSHLSDTSTEENLESLERFHGAVEKARAVGLSPDILHIAASAAATDIPQSRLDMVRVGISVYGVSPFDERTPADMGFAPVMAARARVSHVDTEQNLAWVGMGYGHGLLPLPPHTGWVSLGGSPAQLHSVQVDHLVIGIPHEARVALGDIVTLWGDETSPSAEDWARWAGTIGDEVVSSMGSRVERRFSS